MSNVVNLPSPRSPHLLDAEPYVLCDPSDPNTPRVSSDFSMILRSRTRALNEFFLSPAIAAREVWQRLLLEAYVAALPKRGVRVPRPGEVVGYLLQHPDVFSPVLAIATKARERRGPGDEVSVELYRDPEIRDEYLVVYLRRAKYGEDTLGILDALGEDAALALAGTSGWFLVTTDFRPPQDG